MAKGPFDRALVPRWEHASFRDRADDECLRLGAHDCSLKRREDRDTAGFSIQDLSGVAARQRGVDNADDTVALAVADEAVSGLPVSRGEEPVGVHNGAW